ncbi:MAG: biotin--[acetyl-CoA-carboxylase] ligase [Desulfurococcales archaeon ex4484_217_1]|nr:MAG: biotin--[acetyl-CoA-carboxylase] ligase [Desulfurococcales archaeon ex4484_217_1]
MFSDNMANLEKDIFFKKIGFEYIKYFYSIPSTMDYAKKIADKYNRAIIFSEIQTRGRGRAGRIWLSPPGGIWTTITWSIENMHMLNILSLAIGVSVIKALSNVLLLSFKLKWPNDVMFSAKKIGGILIENIFRERKVLSIIGIGLNVNNKMKFSGLSGVTSNTLRRRNRGEIINSWKKADITLGRKIIIKLSQGGIVEGKALDISNTGGLLIKDNSGRIIEVHISLYPNYSSMFQFE